MNIETNQYKWQFFRILCFGLRDENGKFFIEFVSTFWFLLVETWMEEFKAVVTKYEGEWTRITWWVSIFGTFWTFRTIAIAMYQTKRPFSRRRVQRKLKFFNWNPDGRNQACLSGKLWLWISSWIFKISKF